MSEQEEMRKTLRLALNWFEVRDTGVVGAITEIVGWIDSMAADCKAMNDAGSASEYAACASVLRRANANIAMRLK